METVYLEIAAAKGAAGVEFAYLTTYTPLSAAYRSIK